MAMRTDDKSQPEDSEEKALPSGDLSLPQPEDVEVEYLPEPPAMPEGKQIHPRRTIPRLAQGEEEQDEDPSAPVDIKPPSQGDVS
jgi:hypothetical protein